MKKTKPDSGEIMQETHFGTFHCGDSAQILTSKIADKLKGKVQLILTSPPFPLNNKKS